MPPALFPREPQQIVGPEWSSWIIIVAVLFLACVFAFYYFTM